MERGKSRKREAVGTDGGDEGTAAAARAAGNESDRVKREKRWERAAGNGCEEASSRRQWLQALHK